MTNFEAILKEAHEAATAAQADMVENMNALDCGFAWVTIGGTEPLAAYCRKTLKNYETAGVTNPLMKRKLGSKGYPTGWQFWKPGGFAGQAIGIHEAGAKAFRDVLARHNIVGTVGSRYD